ncbi:MAG: hypothetical protein ACI9ZF_002964 [Bradyrhizobium sp.]|jgi:hypothetical protein
MKNYYPIISALKNVPLEGLGLYQYGDAGSLPKILASHSVASVTYGCSGSIGQRDSVINAGNRGCAQ